MKTHERLVGREAEVGLDLGQGHADDRRVHDDHELRERDDGKGRPAPRVCGLHESAFPSRVGAAHEMMTVGGSRRRSAERQAAAAHRPQPAAPIVAAHAEKVEITVPRTIAGMLDRCRDGLIGQRLPGHADRPEPRSTSTASTPAMSKSLGHRKSAVLAGHALDDVLAGCGAHAQTPYG